MVAVNRKKTALPEARALYAEGASHAEIAESLGVPAGTVRRWASEERRAGRPWERRGKPMVGATAKRSLAVPTPESGHENQHAQAPLGHGTRSTSEDLVEEPSAETPEPPKDRADLCRRLEHRLALLIAQAENDLSDAKVEDRFLKLCRVIDSLRSDTADLDAQMDAMGRFADFCMKNLTEEEMAPVRGPIRQFLDHLKEEHS